MTAEAFVVSPTKSGAKSFLSSLPPKGKENLPWGYTALDAGTADGTWWEATAKNRYDGLEKSIKAVEDAIEADNIVGVIGHEQGGLLAAMVAAKAALGMGPKSLQFAVIANAEMPSGGPMAALFNAVANAPNEIATLHCVSRANDWMDDAPSELGEELAACFPGAELLYHDGGRALPGKTWWKDSNGFPDRATGRSEYTAGLYG